MHSLHWHNRDKKGNVKELAAATSTRGFVRYLLKHLTDGLGRSQKRSRSLSKRSRMGQGLGLIDFLWKLYVQEYTINHANLSSHGDQLPWISASVILVSSKYYFCSYKYFSLISVKMLLCFFIFSSFFCLFNIVLINFYFNLILCYFSTST